MCVGYIQILHNFIQGIWASMDFGILSGGAGVVLKAVSMDTEGVCINGIQCDVLIHMIWW